MKKILLILTFQVMLLPAFAQTVQSVINVPNNQWGGTYQALLYKPAGYDTTTKKYPLLVFAHGRGESDATDSLPMLYNNQTAGGPSYFIEHGQWPSSFTNPRNGQAYQFIVLTPHARGSGWSISATALDYAIRHMVTNYKVDSNKIYITGLSAGGATITEYVGHAPIGGQPFNARYKAAAFVPMSQAFGDPAQSIADNIVADSVRAWGFGDTTCAVSGCDGHGENTNKLIKKINIAKAGFGRFTHYEGGHCCWGNYYKPTYRETINGQSMNIYEWMLQFSRAPVSTPTANAGADKTITLPTSSVTLTGSGTPGAGHTISTTTWSRVSGPSTPTITTPNATSTTVTGLIQGVYFFRFRLINNVGDTATDDVKVTVNPAPNPTDSVRFVKVRMYGGANPFSGWSNWNIGSNLSSGPLLFTNGDSSGVTITVNYLPLIADNLSGRPSYPTTMCPQEVGRYAAYFSSQDAVFTITGLKSNKKYHLETYNTRDKIGPYTTEVTVGSVMRSIITDTNFHNAAKFTNLTTTNGTITFSLHRLSTWAYISGLVLTELDSAASGQRFTVANSIPITTKPQESTVASSWQTYPDPFKDHITIRTRFNNPQASLTARLIDLSGRIVLTRTFGNVPAGHWNERLQVPAGVRKPGFYFLQITGPGLEKAVTIKLLKHQ